MIDSHLHLDDEKLINDIDSIVGNFDADNVDFVINNSSDIASSRKSVELTNTYDKVYATVGIHPHSASEYNSVAEQELITLASNQKVVAIGEIGLDYYYDLSPRDVQKDVFAMQIELADKLKLPVTLHIRDAYGDAVDILNAESQHLNNGVLWHCYSGSEELARQMAKKGHYFAFGGAITFKNAKKEDVIRAVPFDRVLTETDSPYMTPVPLRGTTNNPFNIKYILPKLAESYGKSVEEVEKQVKLNTLRLFTKIKL